MTDTNQNAAQQSQGQSQQSQEQKSSDWRNLEKSRDSYKDRVTKLERQLLTQKVREAGWDPDKGTGKLLRDAFARDNEGIDPEKLDETFQTYVQDIGVEPPGEQSNQEQSQVEQLVGQQQEQSQDLQSLSQQQSGGPKPINQQIAEAQAAGDQDKALQLSYQLATQNHIEAAQKSTGG